MSTEPDTILKAILLLLGSGGAGAALLQRWKPRSRSTSLATDLAGVRADRAEDKLAHESDMADLRQRMVSCEMTARQADTRTRWALDYAEALRRHISDGKPPPPPPWPKEPEFDV